MKWITLFFLIFMGATFSEGLAQQVIYSEPEKDDARTLNFEVVGKVGGKFMVYKNTRDLHFIATYNSEMKLQEKNRLSFLTGRILNTEFVAYPEFAYMIYQFQKRNIMYCMAVKLDAFGKKMTEPVVLDSTSDINYAANNKIYSVINSEDKQKIMVFTVNTKNDKLHVLTTSLFDKELNRLKKSRVNINMAQRNDFLTEFTLDNDGDMIFARASGTNSNDNINKISLVTKKAVADSVNISDLFVKNIYLDDIRIKADNINKHYVVTSFLSKSKRGNIDGLYYTLWDKEKNTEILNASAIFSPEFREDARGEAGTKTAFNDYFLKNIILRKDGGFIVVAESAYTSTRGNTMNRWDYLYGSPYWNPMDYYSWNSPMGYYPWWRNNAMNNNNQTRYYADNIAIVSFEPNGKVEWSNVVRKSQYDDNTDNFIGFNVLNSGGQLHFLFNVLEKRSLILTDQTISPEGQISRNPTYKNLDRGYEFMPRHAKQVGARQAIVPCQYRGFICFAKLEY